jgi:hypothetical protein
LTDPAVFSPDTGVWRIQTTNLSFSTPFWGGPTGIPKRETRHMAPLISRYRASTGSGILPSSSNPTTSRIVTLGRLRFRFL